MVRTFRTSHFGHARTRQTAEIFTNRGARANAARSKTAVWKSIEPNVLTNHLNQRFSMGNDFNTVHFPSTASLRPWSVSQWIPCQIAACMGASTQMRYFAPDQTSRARSRRRFATCAPIESAGLLKGSRIHSLSSLFNKRRHRSRAQPPLSTATRTMGPGRSWQKHLAEALFDDAVGQTIGRYKRWGRTQGHEVKLRATFSKGNVAVSVHVGLVVLSRDLDAYLPSRTFRRSVPAPVHLGGCADVRMWRS
jgi:hypothetical protein